MSEQLLIYNVIHCHQYEIDMAFEYLNFTHFHLLQLGKVVETLTKQIETKGKEMNEYREKHGIRVRGEEEKSVESKKEAPSSSQGVLVAGGDST